MRSQFIVSLALCLVPGMALAQPSETDRSLAQSLFEEGKQLMDQGNYADACPKLVESQRLDPGGGTLLNLGLCHEKEGKFASAWSDFKEALSAARRDNRADRAQAAEEHIKALEAKLPWVTLDVAVPVEGLKVVLRGAEVGKAGWATAVSIDPGTHEVSASAPGYKRWSSTFTITAGEKKTVSVPELEEEPSAATASPVAATPGAAAPQSARSAQPAATPERDAPAPSDGSNAPGWAAIGVGVAAIGVGSYFGIRTFRKRDASDKKCEDDDHCTREGVRLNNEAYTSAWISNVGFGVGLVSVGVGAYLLMSDGGDEAEVSAPRFPVTVDGQIGPGSASLEIRGAF